MVLLFDRFNLQEDFYEILFATEQQALVGKLLVDYIKENGGEIGKTQMSMFATALHDGKLVVQSPTKQLKGKKVKLSYNKRQFYDRILTPFRSMGIIDYDMYKKTYKLSENFKNEMIRLGLLWSKEFKSPPQHFIQDS